MNRGMTLVEMVVVIGLTVAALLAIAVMWSAFSSVFGLGQSTASSGLEARAIMEEIEAMSVPASRAMVVHAFSNGTFTTSTSTLVTELPSINSNGAVVVGKYDYAVVYTSGGNVFRRLEVDAASARRTGTQRLSNASTTLLFSYDSANLTEVTKVTATTTVELLLKGVPVDSMLSSTFYFRNSN